MARKGSKYRREMRRRRGRDEMTRKARETTMRRGAVHHTEQGTWPIPETPRTTGSSRSDPLSPEDMAAGLQGDHRNT